MNLNKKFCYGTWMLAILVLIGSSCFSYSFLYGNESLPSSSKKNVEETKPPQSSPSLNQKKVENYDPIKENGEYFVDWDNPKAAIVLSGFLTGYIEPCGCAGMERMKGGLSRRHDFIKKITNRGWNLFKIDAGEISNGYGVQEELKFDMALNALRLMGYQAIALGKNEMRFPAYFLLTFTAPSGTEEPSLFTSANSAVYSFNSLYTLPYKIIEKDGYRIGVVSVLFSDDNVQHRDENILIEDPYTKLNEILPEIRKENCNKLVLIVHGTEQETIKIAKEFPEFEIVVTSDSPSIPPAEAKVINGTQRLIELGEKGKYIIVLGLYDDEKTPVRYQRVALDSRYTQSKEIHHLMDGYQTILKTLITDKGYKNGLGLSLVESPKRHKLGDFVGSSKCESCHEESYRIWRRNRHSQAWHSLTNVAAPPRDFDPECISCHVIGWQGVENFPYYGGFNTEKTTPQLKEVGCESCHGPGSKHIEAELGNDTKLQESLRSEMRLGSNVKKVCYSCHDADNSPDFDFDSYYKIIEHKEK